MIDPGSTLGDDEKENEHDYRVATIQIRGNENCQ